MQKWNRRTAVLAVLLLSGCASIGNDTTARGAAIIDDQAERIIMLAQGNNRLANLDDAIGMLNAGIRKYPNDPQLYVSLALAYSVKSSQDAHKADTKRDLALSEDIVAHALRLDPNWAPAYVFRASSDYTDRHCIPCAEADLARAAALPEHPTSTGYDIVQPFIHVVRSYLDRDRRDLTGAEKELLQAVAIHGRPGDIATAYANLGYLYAYYLGKPDRADWAYRQGIAAEPDLALLHIEYASLLLFTKGDAEGAIREVQAARALKDPYGTKLYATALYARWAKAYKTDPKGRVTQADWMAATQVMPADGRLVTYMSDSIGMVPTLETLLRSGALKGQDLNVVDENNQPPLVSALIIAPSVPHHNASIVRALLENGADPNLCGPYPSEIPLTFAVRQHDRALVALLLRYGASVDPRHNLMDSPLFAALDDPNIFPLLATKADPKDRPVLVRIAKAELNWQALDALGERRLAAHIKNGFVVSADWHLTAAKAEVITALRAAHIPYQVRQGGIWIRGRDLAQAKPLLTPILMKYKQPTPPRPSASGTAVQQPGPVL